MATRAVISAAIVALIITCVAATVTAGDDPCTQFTSCLTCAGIDGCGWCSAPVTLANGATGAQCASPATTGTFTCNGIFSTNQCLQGYVCDQASGACRLADPGQGTTFDICNAACMVGPTTEVYGCVNGSKSCAVVPPGTPGSSSRQNCEQHCYTPASEVYACDPTTSKCVVVPPGTANAASLEVCQARGCDIGTFGCDLETYTCKPGFGNSSQKFCMMNCRPPNDPCSNYTTCDTCLAASNVCGWCSENVTYASGQAGGRCAGVSAKILPFNCRGSYSTDKCAGPTAAPSAPETQSPDLPPIVDCPRGSMVLLQYNCADSNCNGCNSGTAAECVEPHCTLYCSGKCQPVPYWGTSFMWSCNQDPTTKEWTNATLVHFLKSTQCTGPTNPAGTGGSGTYGLNQCGSPDGPNNPPQYNTFVCVPCGTSCDWH